MSYKIAEPFSRSEPETFARAGYITGTLNNSENANYLSNDLQSSMDWIAAARLKALRELYEAEKQRLKESQHAGGESDFIPVQG